MLLGRAICPLIGTNWGEDIRDLRKPFLHSHFYFFRDIKHLVQNLCDQPHAQLSSPAGASHSTHCLPDLPLPCDGWAGFSSKEKAHRARKANRLCLVDFLQLRIWPEAFLLNFFVWADPLVATWLAGDVFVCLGYTDVWWLSVYRIDLIIITASRTLMLLRVSVRVQAETADILA